MLEDAHAATHSGQAARQMELPTTRLACSRLPAVWFHLAPRPGSLYGLVPWLRIVRGIGSQRLNIDRMDGALENGEGAALHPRRAGRHARPTRAVAQHADAHGAACRCRRKANATSRQQLLVPVGTKRNRCEKLSVPAVRCDIQGCVFPVDSMCTCRRCSRESEPEEKFHACSHHKADVGEMHQRIRGRDVEWSKL